MTDLEWAMYDLIGKVIAKRYNKEEARALIEFIERRTADMFSEKNTCEYGYPKGRCVESCDHSYWGKFSIQKT